MGVIDEWDEVILVDRKTEVMLSFDTIKEQGKYWKALMCCSERDDVYLY
jgi:hypothetical protein